LIRLFFPTGCHHEFYDGFAGIAGSDHGYSFIGLDDEFEVGNVLSRDSEELGVSIHHPQLRFQIEHPIVFE
jgi:hypothetical protein